MEFSQKENFQNIVQCPLSMHNNDVSVHILAPVPCPSVDTSSLCSFLRPEGGERIGFRLQKIGERWRKNASKYYNKWDSIHFD